MQCNNVKTTQVPVQPTTQHQGHSAQNEVAAAEENVFQKMFQAIDANGDGSIDSNEFSEFLEEMMMQKLGDYTECGGHSGDGSGQGDAEAEKAALIAELGTKASNKGLSAFETADAEATRILTGDIDGTMINENIQKLVDRGYCVIVDGEMQCTDKGRALLDFMDAGKGVESQHIIQHIGDHEASLVAEMGSCSCERGLTPFQTADENATRILLGDIDGQMDPNVIEGMIRDGYFRVENGELQATDRGLALLEYMETCEKGFKGQHVYKHRSDYEAMKVAQMSEQRVEMGYEPFTSADASATRILTGDIDGQMHPRIIEGLIQDGYLQIENGELQATDRGLTLLEYMETCEKGFEGQHVVSHRADYEAMKVAQMSEKRVAAGYEPFTSADAGATRMLTGDVDGMMVPHNIQKLIDNQYLQLTDGVLETTAKGQEFLDAMDEQGIRTTHIVHHMQAHEAQLAS